MRAATILLAAAVSANAAQPLLTLASPARPGRSAFAKSGRAVASVCRDGKIRVWSLAGSQLLRTIDVSGRDIDELALSEDGRYLAAGDHGGRYDVWATATGASVLGFQLPFYAASIAFSPDESQVAIAPVGEPAQVFDLASGKKRFELARIAGGTYALAYSRDGARLAAADTDTVVRVYDARNGELISRNEDFLLEPLAVAFAPGGGRVFAAGADKVFAVLDPATGRTSARSGKLADPVIALDSSPDGTHAAAMLMHADNLLELAPALIIESATGKTVDQWTPPERPLGGAWLSDGRLLVATAEPNGLRLWRLR